MKPNEALWSPMNPYGALWSPMEPYEALSSQGLEFLKWNGLRNWISGAQSLIKDFLLQVKECTTSKATPACPVLEPRLIICSEEIVYSQRYVQPNGAVSMLV